MVLMFEFLELRWIFSVQAVSVLYFKNFVRIKGKISVFNQDSFLVWNLSQFCKVKHLQVEIVSSWYRFNDIIVPSTLLLHSGPAKPGPNISTTPLWQWGFRQCLPFSWTTLRGKHCWHPIAVLGVVDMFGPGVYGLTNTVYTACKHLPRHEDVSGTIFFERSIWLYHNFPSFNRIDKSYFVRI